MINEKELQISNKSYINKDFQTIYPELLDNYKSLTNRYDPSASNESDPFVVLLKQMAFMGDKLNYNIDKNILENYVLSCTQEESMRKICDMMGYNMRYYQSAITDVSFMYTGTKLDEIKSNGINDYINLQKFKTTITDDNNSVIYTLISDCVISNKNTTFSAAAIEGTIKDLLISGGDANINLGNGSGSIIQLENIDDNNRVYFPQKMVAENGIFVSNISDTESYWEKVDNLNIQEPKSYVYKFGYDSKKDLPYIEFPEDISYLIGSGISVKYIETKGVDGNIKRGILTKISTPTTISTFNNNIQVYPETEENANGGNLFIITNVSATNNGRDPETINEANNGFKKTVGTFDTLITCKDYANFIYNMEDDSSEIPLVSNVQVTDRRTDLNYSNNIVSFNDYGNTKINNIDNTTITPFDLCLYPLQSLKTKDNSYDRDTYDESFKPLYDLTDIEAKLEDNKNIAHTYKKLNDDDIYCIKNYYSLNAKISTENKVNSFEEENILTHVQNALYQKFNARNVDYGYEIPYDTLLETIKEADTRIKNVSLDEPILKTYAMYTDGTEEEFNVDNASGYNAYIDYTAKNILAGRISLFDRNRDFEIDFGQTIVSDINDNVLGPKIDNIISITSEVKIPMNNINNGYTLADNEVIQCIAPNLTTEISYPYGVNYHWEGNDIEANTEYKLVGDDLLIFNYTDSNKKEHNIKYTATSIIEDNVEKSVEFNLFKPNFKLVDTETFVGEGNTPIVKKVGENNVNFFTIGTDETIDRRVFVEASLNTSGLPVYWIRNTTDNYLFSENDAIYTKTNDTDIILNKSYYTVDSLVYTKVNSPAKSSLSNYYEISAYQVILSENEYFIYSNTALTELNVLGSGTQITYNVTSDVNLASWIMNNETIVNIDDINNNGLAAFSTLNWKYVKFGLNENINLKELQILTLVGGDKIKTVNGTLPAYANSTVSNNFEDLTADSISYWISGEAQDDLPLLNIDGLKWKIRSRLDFNSGPGVWQLLTERQIITFNYMKNGEEQQLVVNPNDCQLQDDETGEVFVGPYVLFNTLIQRSGGDNIDMKVTYLDGTSGYDVSALVFKYAQPYYVNESSDEGDYITNLNRVNDYITITCSKVVSNKDVPLNLITWNNSPTQGKTQLIMFYWKHDNTVNDTLSIKLKTGASNIRLYNSGENLGTQIELHHGINIIEYNYNSNVNSIKIAFTGFYGKEITDELLIGDIVITNSFNSILGLSDSDINSKLLSYIKNYSDIGDGTLDYFYYNKDVNNSSLIDVTSLNTPEALWNYNNLCNRITLPEIDFDTTNISIVKTSKL